jgi:peptidoglycan/xylan/chitin deacetylase (PgdA/CDA1 family)
VLPIRTRQVAVTVDLGSGSEGLAPILSALAEHRVAATFFVTGTWARRNPDGLRSIVAGGHVVGNHTDTHPHLTTMTDEQVLAELAAAEDAVRAVTGTTTRPLLRFPFGDRDARTLDLVRSDGWCAYRWTVDTLGWKGTSSGQSAATVRDRVLAALRPGAIVLMHGGAHPDDRSTLDADALPGLLDELHERGYALTTLPPG